MQRPQRADERDQDAAQRLDGLIARACDRRGGCQLEPALLQAIKALCRQSDANVLLAWDALWGRLRATHAQSRLLALMLCEQLFARSRAFRQALLSRLSQFLELVVGFRADRPLPPPAAAAASLRERALELLDSWDRQHGRRHPQLPLAVRYLKDTLQLQFPEIASRAAAEEAERAAHAERQRQQLRRQLGRLLGGGEWREGAAGARQLLLEVDECFAILDEQQAAAAADAAAPQGAEQQQQGQQGQQQQEVPGDAGMEWEDVPAAGGDAGPALDGAPGEGLAAYGAAGDAAEAAAAAEGRRAGTQGGAEAELAVVRETLAGLYRQLANRVLPQLQERLSVLARAESEGPAQEAERQRTLRAGTELRGRLAAAKARCDAMALDLDALLLRRQRLEAAQAAGAGGGERPRRGGENGQQAAAVAAAMQDLFGDSSEEDEEEGSRQDGGPQNTATGPAARGQQQQRRGQRPGRPPRRREEDDFVSPYMRIVDPAAPRPRLPHHQQQQQQQSESKTKPPPRQQPASSLPEDVRKRLAEQAPVLPTGPHTQFWDSKSVPTYVSGHGLEVSNHWGAVDVHQELPPERVEELFLLPMPASRQQAAANPQRQCQQPSNGTRPQQARQQQCGRRGSSAQAANEEASRNQSNGAPAPPQALQPWPSRQAGTAAGPSTAAGSDGSGRAAKRTRRAEERAYNEAVIGGALSDELVARQLQDAEQQAAAGEQGQQADGGRQRGRGAKKISVRNRLAQKLLRGGAVAAAVRDVTTEESELRRERFGNRW